MSSPANSATPGPSDNKQQQQQQQNAGNSGDQQRGSPALTNLPSQADIDKIVASYLQKKGYKATEAIFMKELSGSTLSLDQLSQELASSDKSYGNQVLKYGEEGDPNAYSVSYRSLRKWIESSLDWYKVIYLGSIGYDATMMIYSFFLIARASKCSLSHFHPCLS